MRIRGTLMCFKHPFLQVSSCSKAISVSNCTLLSVAGLRPNLHTPLSYHASTQTLYSRKPAFSLLLEYVFLIPNIPLFLTLLHLRLQSSALSPFIKFPFLKFLSPLKPPWIPKRILNVILKI